LGYCAVGVTRCRGHHKPEVGMIQVLATFGPVSEETAIFFIGAAHLAFR
jgi:hypothetical protein